MPKSGTARILLWDAETAPCLGWAWGRHEVNLLGDLEKERQIICLSWKWLDEDEIHVRSLASYPRYKKDPDDNRPLLREFYQEIAKAHIVIGHNMAGFDDKMINTDLVIRLHKLGPLPPHKVIDTLKVARSKFRFTSNRLGDLGRMLGLGSKVRTGGFKLWRACLAGDLKAWAKMERYCAGDTRLLERVYLRLRPWMDNHPNLNIYDDTGTCPVCKSNRCSTRGTAYLASGKRIRYRCRDCGKWFSGKKMKNGRTRFS